MTSDAELSDVPSTHDHEADWSVTASQPRDGRAESYGPLVAATLWVYVGPCIFVVGLCGNALVLAVMSQRRMRGTSTCVYLQWMAVADICVLVSGMITEWVEALFDVIFKELDERLCKLEKFMFYTSSDTSIWILVGFTVDRLVAVCFPLQHRHSCFRPSNAKYYAVAALLAAVVKNLHVLWTRGAEFRPAANGSNTELELVKNCGRPTEEYEHFEFYVRPWIAFAVVFALPFCVIVFCNVFIIRAMVRYHRARSTHLTIPVQDKSVYQMTVLCLSASFCFLICVTPSMILLIGKPYWNEPPSDWYAIAKSITNQIFYINHSANFFLYCITGQRFRTAMWSLMRCRMSEFDRFNSDPAIAYLATLANRSRTPSPAMKARASKMGAGWGSTGQLQNILAVPDHKHRKSSPAVLLNVQALRRESVV